MIQSWILPKLCLSNIESSGNSLSNIVFGERSGIHTFVFLCNANISIIANEALSFKQHIPFRTIIQK